jgi:hypothetical protein
MTLLVSASSSGGIEAVAAGVRDQIARVAARVPVFGLQEGAANLSFAYWGPQLAAGMFGGLALALAMIGLCRIARSIDHDYERKAPDRRGKSTSRCEPAGLPN